MSLTPEQSHFLQNLRLHLIDLSRRLEQDVNENVADYELFRLQQTSNQALYMYVVVHELFNENHVLSRGAWSHHCAIL